MTARERIAWAYTMEGSDMTEREIEALLTSGKIVDKMRNITWYNDIVD